MAPRRDSIPPSVTELARQLEKLETGKVEQDVYKVEKDVINARLKKMDKHIEKPHDCLHEEELKKNTLFRENLSKFKIGGVVVVVAFIIGAYAQYYSLTSGVDQNREDIVVVQATIEEVKISQQNLEKSLGGTLATLQGADEVREKRRMKKMRTMLKDVVAEVKLDFGEKKKR